MIEIYKTLNHLTKMLDGEFIITISTNSTETGLLVQVSYLDSPLHAILMLEESEMKASGLTDDELKQSVLALLKQQLAEGGYKPALKQINGKESNHEQSTKRH